MDWLNGGSASAIRRVCVCVLVLHRSLTHAHTHTHTLTGGHASLVSNLQNIRVPLITSWNGLHYIYSCSYVCISRNFFFFLSVFREINVPVGQGHQSLVFVLCVQNTIRYGLERAWCAHITRRTLRASNEHRCDASDGCSVTPFATATKLHGILMMKTFHITYDALRMTKNDQKLRFSPFFSFRFVSFLIFVCFRLLFSILIQK